MPSVWLTAPIIRKMRQRPMTVNLSVLMSAIPRLPMKNFFFLKGSISTSPADSKRITSSPIRYASPLSREKSPRKKQIKWAMKRQCAGRRANTLSLWQPTSTKPIYTIISFIIPLPLIAPGSSIISSFPGWRYRS